VGNAAFVLIAVGVAALASLLLWVAHRRPRTFMSSIEDFQREMKALSREEEEQQARRRPSLRSRGSTSRDESLERD
jgi:hypothetical protein